MGLQLLILSVSSFPALYKDLPFLLAAPWGFVGQELQSAMDQCFSPVCKRLWAASPGLESPWEWKKQSGIGKAGPGGTEIAAFLSQPCTTRCPQQYRHCCGVWRWHLSISSWAGAGQGPSQAQLPSLSNHSLTRENQSPSFISWHNCRERAIFIGPSWSQDFSYFPVFCSFVLHFFKPIF